MYIFNDVVDFLDEIPVKDSAKIYANISSLDENQIEGLVIKSIGEKIKEMIVKQYRIIFFYKNRVGYVVDAFKKQSQKTPQRIIKRAEKIYKNIKN